MTPLDHALAFTLRKDIEGEWYDGSGSHDPNPTMLGVTQRTYDRWRDKHGLGRRTVRHIAMEEVKAIAAVEYSEAAGCEMMPTRVAVAHFDAAYNMGPQAAIRTLQRALGVEVDGIVGPKTILAIDEFTPERMLIARMRAYYRLIADKPKLGPALKHWLYRVCELHTYLLTL
jgi:lysozyme family protein